MCLFLCKYLTLLITVALQYSLKSGRMIPPALFFFLKIALTIQGLLCFHINFRIVCSSSVRNTMSILIVIALNLWIALGSIDILTTLTLPIHENKICFQFFVSSSISFINIFLFLEYRSFVSFVKFIPRYFIMFDAISNRIVSCFLFLIAHY